MKNKLWKGKDINPYYVKQLSQNILEIQDDTFFYEFVQEDQFQQLKQTVQDMKQQILDLNQKIEALQNG